MVDLSDPRVRDCLSLEAKFHLQEKERAKNARTRSPTRQEEEDEDRERLRAFFKW